MAELEAWIDRRDGSPGACRLGAGRSDDPEQPRLVLIGASRTPALMAAAYRAGATSFVGVETLGGWREDRPLDSETLLRLIRPPEVGQELGLVDGLAASARGIGAELRSMVER